MPELCAKPAARPRPDPAAAPHAHAQGASLGPILGRYLLAQIARPFCATLLVALAALLLERLLRLFDLVASKGAPGAAVLRMLLYLVPHYLGLALPAALFISITVVVARLGASNELDAMQSAGIALRRISLPFAAAGAFAALLSFGLYNYAQPWARYAYRAAFQQAVDGGWNATIPAGEVTRLSSSLVITADKSDQASGRLGGLLIYQRKPDGSQQLTTARTGRLTLSPDGTELLLLLQDATRLDTQKDGKPGWLTAPSTTQLRPFVLPFHPFRPRGADAREMTLGELWASREAPREAGAGQAAGAPIDRHELDGELHSRLIRTLSLAVLPLLAVPFGLAAKRTAGRAGIPAGVLIVVLYYHALQMAQSFGTARHFDPGLLLWVVFAVFAATTWAFFRRAERHTADGPLDGLFDALDGVLGSVLARWRAFRTRSPA